ncbi:hypothetical protein KP79_PYT03908 [Mizuhopecten yessoensis]|uniref:Uncharacterized protein n=1 Tax=Mizuhopecten yessoensis TaxID=6573 RepID=A0A210PFS3_MIZYE|nr:hypothetical protein KP79_PYT03908 [Mizuhopecten yessoensis]
MFDQFPSNSGLHLWSDTEETKNEFINYLTSGFGLIYLMCLGLAYANSRSKSSIIVVPPNEDVEDENSLHKYLLVLTTSLARGSSCSSHAKVFLQIIGQNVQSKYYNIKVFASNRFLLQRGNTDILLIRTKDYLGPLQEVKVVVSGLKTVTWRPSSVSVTCMTTGETYSVDCRLIGVNDTTSEGEGGLVFSCSDDRKLWSCHAILKRIVTFHPWLSPFNVPLRFGKFTPVVSTNIVFLALISLMTLTLVGYILTSVNVTDNFSLEIECVIMAVVAAVTVDLLVYLSSVMLRNVKAGKQEMIDKLFPKSDMTEHYITDGEHYNGKQGKVFSLKKSEVCFNISESESSAHDARIGEKMSDTHFKSCFSIDLVQPEQSGHIKPDEYLSEPYQSHGEQQDVTDVRIKGSSQDMTGTRNVFKSCTAFEVCHLEGGSHVESSTSDVGILYMDIKTSLSGLDELRDIDQDSNNSAGKDGHSTRKKDGKMGKHNMKSLTEDKKKCAQGGTNDDKESAKGLGALGNVVTSKTSVFGTEKFDEFKHSFATSEKCMDLDAESDEFLNVAHSEFQIDINEPLHSVSNEWPSTTDSYRKNCLPSASVPCNHTVTQSQPLKPIEENLLKVGCVDATVQGSLTRTEESLGSSLLKPKREEYPKASFYSSKSEESAGNSLSKLSEDDSLESAVSKSVRGKVQHPEAQGQSTNYHLNKEVEEESSTFKASFLDVREDDLSSDQVSIHVYLTDETKSEDNGEHFFEIENKASDNQFYSSRHSKTGKDEPIGLHSVLLSQRKTNVTTSESDKVQQQIDERLAQLQRKAKRFSMQLLLQFCVTCRLLLTNVSSSVLYKKTKVSTQTWLTNVTEEQVFSVLHTNRILEIQKDPLAVRRASLSDEVLNRPLSQTLAAQCVQQCIQSVCEAMALPRPPNFKQRLVSVIEETLKQHLHHFTQEFYDELKQTSKRTDLWPSVSTEDSIAYNWAQPHLYEPQSCPLLQHQESVNWPTPMISKSAEHVDTCLQDLSSFFVECVQTCVLRDEGDNFSVTVIPISTSLTEDQDGVQVLLGPEFSRSFMELPIESELCRSALDGAKKELWIEYQDPIPVYTMFLMQAVTLDKLKTVLTRRNSQEKLSSDHKSFEDLNVKQKVLEIKSEKQMGNQSVEDSELTQGLRTTPSEKLGKFASGLSRKISLLRESKTALIPLLLKKSDTKELSSTRKTEELHPLIPCLDKKWHQLGFHHKVNANKNLAQALMTKLLKDWKEEQGMSMASEEDLMLEKVSCLYRIEKELNNRLAKYAAACFERWCPYIQCIVADCGADTGRAGDQVFAVVDVASQEMIASLENIVLDAFNSEMAKTIATLTVQDSISQAFSNLDIPQTPLTDDSDKKTVTSYEMNLAEIVKDFLPLRAYMTFVTNSERILSKQLIKANYLNRYQRKHNKFAAITLQHVLDSYYDKDPQMLDTTLTNETLQQLEWHVLHENTKVIPNIIGRVLTFVLFCLAVFGLVYVSIIGGSLTVTQIQEWMSCFCISIAIYGFVLEPFVAIVGYLGY